MIKVGIVGYGTIGRRVADAVELQKDMKLVGVVKNSPDYGALIAKHRHHKLFCMDKSRFEGSGIEVEGSVAELVDESDILVDCAPKKYGQENKDKFYVPAGKPAIFQGAEKATISMSFNANANYEEAMGQKFLRVVSCNTTGLSRLLHLVQSKFGIKLCNATLIRRAADPKEYKKGPIDAIVPDPIGISHHAPDVKTVMDVNLFTTAWKVPSTIMHTHDLYIETEKQLTEGDLIQAIMDEPRILLADPALGFKSTAQIVDFARDFRVRSDIFESVVFKGFTVDGNKIYLSQAIHQESIVVPDNIDAIRAIYEVPKDESVPVTDRTLEIGKRQMCIC
ncbi:MAG: type II glyceraldehyde-3-phosphate dehydrogenase [Candidatus Altiarchaeota archaeon]|nr:type II glyceraldehyde-3-phosphate dehydrogenase [Candidatus Altiarchaeota archaeon]